MDFHLRRKVQWHNGFNLISDCFWDAAHRCWQSVSFRTYLSVLWPQLKNIKVLIQHDVRLFDTNCTEPLLHLYHSLIIVMVIASCRGRVVRHFCDNRFMYLWVRQYITFFSLFSPFSLPDLARRPPAFSIVPTDLEHGTGFISTNFSISPPFCVPVGDPVFTWF